jgi:dihydrofolate reductase
MIRKPIISLIAAIGENRELGKNNKLLWHIPEDMKRFKKLTTGHPVIMGRTTYESMGKPLSNRINIIITRDKNYKADGCFIFHSIEDAIEFAKQKDDKEIIIIGGGQIYKQAIKYSDKLYLTIVKGSFDSDTYFPDYPEFGKVIYEKENDNGEYKYIFLELGRSLG